MRRQGNRNDLDMHDVHCTPISGPFRGDFRATLERFQGDFRAISGRFQGDFRAISGRF
jgi:hypothetical protein